MRQDNEKYGGSGEEITISQILVVDASNKEHAIDTYLQHNKTFNERDKIFIQFNKIFFKIKLTVVDYELNQEWFRQFVSVYDENRTVQNLIASIINYGVHYWSDINNLSKAKKANDSSQKDIQYVSSYAIYSVSLLANQVDLTSSAKLIKEEGITYDSEVEETIVFKNLKNTIKSKAGINYSKRVS